MSAPVELTALLETLSNVDDKLETLHKIRTLIGPIHTSALKDFISNLSFETLFQSLNTNDR